MVCLTASSGSCSKSRTLLHVWLPVPLGVIISHQLCHHITPVLQQLHDGLTMKWHAWYTSHCRTKHPGTWLMTSTLLPTVVLVYFDQHMTRHVRYLGVGHTPALATEVSASMDHMCGMLCHRLCDKTLAMDSLSDNWNHFCFGVS